MNSVLTRIIRKLRLTFCPTELDKEVKRWFSDNSDDNIRYDYALDNSSLVMDLGGYKGQWASDIYSRYNCKIMVFEPVPSFAKKIESRFEKNPMIETYCFALGKRQRQEIIAISDDGSSVFKKSILKETIQFEDVNDFFKSHNIAEINLMKINIEGGEYELLPRLIETGIINKIINIQIQFHNISPDSETSMNNICNNLRETHIPTYRYKFVWENWVRRES